MKQNFKFLQSILTVVLCGVISIAFYSCSDDDSPKPSQAIEGEWIEETDADIYYQFLSDGTGRYICLADEPGYNPEHPETSIKNPKDPYYFDYTVEGNILTMKEYYSQDKSDFTIYVNEIEITKDVLKMKNLRWSDDGTNWYDKDNSDWDVYNRWSASK